MPQTPDRAAKTAPPIGSLHGEARRRAMVLVTVAWMFGSIWMTATAGAPLTQYVTALKATPFQFGVLAALPFLASALTLPASLLIERTGRRKSVFLAGLYLMRWLWLPLALLPIFIVKRGGFDAAPAAMVLFLSLYTLMQCGQAFGSPAWMSWMADIVPERVRGRYFSRRRQLGILPAIPVAIGVGMLLDRTQAAGDPMLMLWVCAGIFIGAAVFGLLDIATFHWVPEPHKPPQKGKHLFRAMRGPLHDKEFLWFAGFVATVVFSVSFMAQFLFLYIIEHVGATNRDTQMMLLVVPMVAQLAVFRIWGHAVDRMGKRPVMKLAVWGFAPVAIGWCLVTREHVWIGYTMAALGAITWTGVEVANMNMLLEFAGSKNRAGGGTAYVAVNTVIIAAAGTLGGLASGAIAQGLKDWSWQPYAGMKAFTYFDVLFVLSGLLRVLAVVVFVPRMIEPQAKRSRDTLRFMASGVYNNMHNLVLQPAARFLKSRGSSADDEG